MPTMRDMNCAGFEAPRLYREPVDFSPSAQLAKAAQTIAELRDELTEQINLNVTLVAQIADGNGKIIELEAEIKRLQSRDRAKVEAIPVAVSPSEKVFSRHDPYGYRPAAPLNCDPNKPLGDSLVAFEDGFNIAWRKHLFDHHERRCVYCGLNYRAAVNLRDVPECQHA